MINVIIPTKDRPQMLRTALRSVARQTAREKIERVVVSETSPGSESEIVCKEFPSLPIEYVLREQLLKPLEHTALLFAETAALSGQFTAVLHDDDWWGPNHLAIGLAHLGENPDALAYWTASFMVYGERSWIHQCWNVTSWIAADYPPLDTVVKMDAKTAALSCITSGPAAYTSLIGRKAVLPEAFSAVALGGNLFDHDRLFFLELVRRGPLLVNLLAQVYVREHGARDQHIMGEETASQHIAAATNQVLAFCEEFGIDVKSELERRCASCPMPESGAFWIASTMDRRVKPELLRRGVLPDSVVAIVDPPPPSLPPLPSPPPPEPIVKTVARWICPAGPWQLAKSLSGKLAQPAENGDSAEAK